MESAQNSWKSLILLEVALKSMHLTALYEQRSQHFPNWILLDRT